MDVLDETLDLSPVGIIFRKISKKENGKTECLEMEWELLPGADGTPLHIHPTASEKYIVLEGTVEIFTDGGWKLLTQGEQLEVPAGHAHTFRNLSSTSAKILNTHCPALHFYEYFRDLSRIVSRFSKGSKEKLKVDLKMAMHLSMLMKKYPAEIKSLNPPPIMVSIFNRLGKLRGFKV